MTKTISKTEAARLQKEGVTFTPKRKKVVVKKATAKQAVPPEVAAPPVAQDMKRLDDAVALSMAATAAVKAVQAQVETLTEVIKSLRAEVATLHPAKYVVQRDNDGIIMAINPVPPGTTH